LIATHARATKIAVPEDIRLRTRVSRVDYESAFSIGTDAGDRRSPEQWARATYESPPAADRLFVWYGWKALTARLGPYPSDDHVLGYRIEANERDYICFGVEWALGLACDLLLYIRPSEIALASFVELKRPAARVVWPTVVPIHERIVPRWLGRAARAAQLP
jgi:hypothetical protein